MLQQRRSAAIATKGFGYSKSLVQGALVWGEPSGSQSDLNCKKKKEKR
jgi:hypothetical protein